jgi:hypothetical protein
MVRRGHRLTLELLSGFATHCLDKVGNDDLGSFCEKLLDDALAKALACGGPLASSALHTPMSPASERVEESNIPPPVMMATLPSSLPMVSMFWN